MDVKRNSPLFFSSLLQAMRLRNVQELNQFFPLRNDHVLVRRKHGYNYYEFIDIRPYLKSLESELINPLFKYRGINIKDEDRPEAHRRENLFCLVDVTLKNLRRIRRAVNSNDRFLRMLSRYQKDYKIITGIARPPFLWITKRNQSQESISELRKRLNALQDDKSKIENNMVKIENNIFFDGKTSDNLIKGLAKRWAEIQENINELENEIQRRDSFDADNIDHVIKALKYFQSFLKSARGKSGRHPGPFNVFIYHLINKCTTRKFDKNRQYVYRKDGQHKLEKNWNLILYLLLYIHNHVYRLPELKEFITQHENKPANEALRALKQRLLNIYKNFPPLDGYPFQRGLDKTGFRKLIVTPDYGHLKAIWF